MEGLVRCRGSLAPRPRPDRPRTTPPAGERSKGGVTTLLSCGVLGVLARRPHRRRELRLTLPCPSLLPPPLPRGPVLQYTVRGSRFASLLLCAPPLFCPITDHRNLQRERG